MVAATAFMLQSDFLPDRRSPRARPGADVVLEHLAAGQPSIAPSTAPARLRRESPAGTIWPATPRHHADPHDQRHRPIGHAEDGQDSDKEPQPSRVRPCALSSSNAPARSRRWLPCVGCPHSSFRSRAPSFWLPSPAGDVRPRMPALSLCDNGAPRHPSSNRSGHRDMKRNGGRLFLRGALTNGGRVHHICIVEASSLARYY
jgi:hypothetical protein